MKDITVVKIGGSTLGSHDTALEDIAALQAEGRALIVVHGGGNAATEWLKIHGVNSEFVDGLRVTGPDAIDVVVAVFAGLVNKQIVAGLQSLGARAIGLSGADGGMLRTRQLDPRLGYVGEVIEVDERPLRILLDAGYMPVISSVGYWGDEPQRLMNINADTVAGDITASVGATDLVFLTDVASVRGAQGESLSELKPDEVEALIASGAASGGMIPKLRAGVRAAGAGARCHIIDGREAHALKNALQANVVAESSNNRGGVTGTRVTV